MKKFQKLIFTLCLTLFSLNILLSFSSKKYEDIPRISAAHSAHNPAIPKKTYFPDTGSGYPSKSGSSSAYERHSGLLKMLSGVVPSAYSR